MTSGSNETSGPGGPGDEFRPDATRVFQQPQWDEAPGQPAGPVGLPPQQWTPPQPQAAPAWGQQPAQAQPPAGGQPAWGAPAPTQTWGQQGDAWGQAAPGPMQQPGGRQAWGTPQQQPPAVGGQPAWGAPAQPLPKSGGGLPMTLLAIIGAGVLVIIGGIVAVAMLLGSKTLDQKAAQDGIKQILTSNYGIQGVGDVSCPSGIKVKINSTFDCQVKIGGDQKKVTAKFTSEDGTYEVGQPS